MKGTLAITGDRDADRLLNTDPLALLIGMLLDQQVPMEWAFKGPALLKQRLGGKLDADEIAAMDAEELVVIFCAKPALHRFPASMARRAHDLCVVVAKDYDGNAEKIWKDAKSGRSCSRASARSPGTATRSRRSSSRSSRSA